MVSRQILIGTTIDYANDNNCFIAKIVSNSAITNITGYVIIVRYVRDFVLNVNLFENLGLKKQNFLFVIVLMLL